MTDLCDWKSEGGKPLGDGGLWRRRLYLFLVPGVMFLLSLLTVLLGPMALVRYVLIFYYAFPIVLPLALYPGWFTKGQSCRSNFLKNAME